MARDEQTGELVGITDTPIPHDFYVATAKQLIQNTDPESEHGKVLSKMPMKKVRKQISKRGSMTRAYSAGAGTISENMWVDVKQDNGHIDYFDFDKIKEEVLKVISKASVEMSKLITVNSTHEEYYDQVKDARVHLLRKHKGEYFNDNSFSKLYPNLPDKVLSEISTDITTEYCLKLCGKFSRGLVKAIKEVCPGPLETMKFFQKLVDYELGEFKMFYEGEENTKLYKQLRAEKYEILDKEHKTDDDLEELNRLSIELDKFESVCVHGNGSKSVKWTTPAGFPVEFTAWKTRQGSCFIPIKKLNKYNGINVMTKIDTDIPDKRDFASGISPNIVHSYDSAHLAKTCVRHTGTFAGIHDSFSTHASDVPALLRATQETFVEIYKDKDILQTLKEQMLTDDKDFDYEKPAFGNLDIEKVYESTFFFG